MTAYAKPSAWGSAEVIEGESRHKKGDGARTADGLSAIPLQLAHKLGPKAKFGDRLLFKSPGGRQPESGLQFSRFFLMHTLLLAPMYISPKNYTTHIQQGKGCWAYYSV